MLLRVVHLFLVSALQISPLLDWPAQVNGVHGQLDFSNHVMFGKSVIVIDGHAQRLPTELFIRNLRKTESTFQLYSLDLEKETSLFRFFFWVEKNNYY